MKVNLHISVALVTLITCVLTLWIYASSSIDDVPVIGGLYDKGRDRMTFISLKQHSPEDINLAYIKQRNNISRLLNLKQKIIAQNECEVGTALPAKSESDVMVCYKVIRALESIDHLSINPIRRIGLIHM